MTRKPIYLGIASLWGALTLSTPAPAEVISPNEDSILYYEIGGARALSAPATKNDTLTIGGSIELGLGYSCAKFDPVIGVTNTLNNIKNGVDNMMDAMVAAAGSAIASLPAYVLQRANPGLYDLFQNALIKAEESVNLATKTCEQMEAEIAKGKNPYDEWVVLSKGHDWKAQMGVSGIDVITAKQNVETGSGRNGVPWPVIGGKAGGEGQPPIRVIGDSVKAGWNVLAGRPPHSAGSVPVTPTSPHIVTVWDSPEEARNYGVRVLGDKYVRTCASCERGGKPGVGLLPDHEETATLILPEVEALVDGTKAPTLTNLEAVSAPGVVLTREVIEAIRSLPADEQAIVMGKLTDEISLARVLERALLLRRALLASRSVPEIAASLAVPEIVAAVAELDREIDNLMFEARVRREVVSDTALQVVRDARERRARKTHDAVTPFQDPNPLRDGEVIR